MEAQNQFCPECGSQESGYFCRNCGSLIRGDDRVLCPRCHHIVPAGKFCNQCGQSVAGIGLNLRQLALAGDVFWVTSPSPVPAAPSADEAESSLLSPDQAGVAPVALPAWLAEVPPKQEALQPDESVDVAPAQVPDWLAAGPAPRGPGADSRLYPKLGPIEPEARPVTQRGFVAAVLILMLIIFIGLAFMILFIMLRTGG